MTTSCLCGSKKPFDKCCERYLDKGGIPKTPEQLMRSRFSAYALGGYGEYLLKTWYPPTAQGLNVASLSEKSQQWVKLEVINTSQKGDEGTVAFRAYFTQGDALEVMHEKSVFQRVAGRWYYVGGEVTATEGL